MLINILNVFLCILMTIYKYDHMALGNIRWCPEFKVAGLLRFIFLHLKLLLLVSQNVKNNGSNSNKYRLKMKRENMKKSGNCQKGT
jgi:hypothetical protein